MESTVYLRLMTVILLSLPLSQCTISLQASLSPRNCFTKTYKYCRRTTSKLSTTPFNGYTPDTHVYMFTRDNPTNPEFLHECAFKLSETSNFKATSPIEIFIHGFIGNMCSVRAFSDMKDELMKKGDYNVVFIDWTWGNQEYLEAIKNAHKVASQIAALIKNIMRQKSVPSTSFHITGHSLGAQIAGLVGNHIKIYRITGLDPAGVNYKEDLPTNKRLDKSDSHIVDVIHTNMGPCMPYMGIDYEAGHANFIVNGGSHQEYCPIGIIESLLRGDTSMAVAMMLPNSCSHVYALEYYRVSINPGSCQFVGIDCKDYDDFKSRKCHRCKDSHCAVMGMDFDKYINDDLREAFPVTFYVDTGMKCPYCNNDHLNMDGFFDFSSNIPQ